VFAASAIGVASAAYLKAPGVAPKVLTTVVPKVAPSETFFKYIVWVPVLPATTQRPKPVTVTGEAPTVNLKPFWLLVLLLRTPSVSLVM
jgi:hypothetical protein